MHKHTYLLLFIFLTIVSCKKDEVESFNASTIQFSTYSDGKLIGLNDSISLYNGIPYKITAFKYYISNIRLVNHQGKEISFKMNDENLGADLGVFLFELGKNEQITGSLPDNHYIKIKFDLGLDSDLNDINPNQFSSQHPLSRTQDMFWDMLKYRFVVIEGIADTAKIGEYKFPFSYHIGGAIFLRDIELDIDEYITDGEVSTLPIQFNFDRIFNDGTNQIDISKFFSYHSTEDQKSIGIEMMNNISNAFE